MMSTAFGNSLFGDGPGRLEGWGVDEVVTGNIVLSKFRIFVFQESFPLNLGTEVHPRTNVAVNNKGPCGAVLMC